MPLPMATSARCARRSEPGSDGHPLLVWAKRNSLAGAQSRRDFCRGTRPATPTRTATAARPPRPCSTPAAPK